MFVKIYIYIGITYTDHISSTIFYIDYKSGKAYLYCMKFQLSTHFKGILDGARIQASLTGPRTGGRTLWSPTRVVIIVRIRKPETSQRNARKGGGVAKFLMTKSEDDFELYPGRRSAGEAIGCG